MVQITEAQAIEMLTLIYASIGAHDKAVVNDVARWKEAGYIKQTNKEEALSYMKAADYSKSQGYIEARIENYQLACESFQKHIKKLEEKT